MAKLMLNSFWGKYTKQKNEERHLYFINVSFLILGKFAQRPNMTKVKIISDPAEYFDLLSSDQIIIEVHFENVDEFVEADGKTNVVIAAFTTAHARLKLYSVLEQLDRRVLYFDTDSVYMYQRTVNGNHQQDRTWEN